MPWQINSDWLPLPVSLSAVKLSPFPLLELESTGIFSWVFMLFFLKSKYILLCVIKKNHKNKRKQKGFFLKTL